MDELIINDSLTLRRLKVDDASELFALIHNSRTHVGEWLPWVDKTTSVADSERFIHETEKKYKETRAVEYGIYLEGKLVGIIGMRYFDEANKKTELGYWLGKEYQGRGIMTKSVQKILEYCFQELQIYRVEIRAHTSNAKSRAVPERLKFTFEGILRSDSWREGKPEDHAVYSMLKNEYKA